MAIELSIKKTVKKSNILNEMRNANCSLVEYRLFCVYMAHLPMNSDDNKVTFKLADYARIVGLDRPRKEDLEEQAHNLVSKTMQLDDKETGGFEVVPMFQRFKLTHEMDGWYVTLECNNQIAPKIKEHKGYFLRYKLYNTIYLKSFNQHRIYELLKQYEVVGERLLDLKTLRELLSIEEGEYPVWYDFSSKVLKVAQKALKEHTDICFDYEPIKKGRKVTAVKFIIQKNEKFIDQLRIDNFMPETDDYYDPADYDADSFEIIADDVSAQKEPSELDFFRTALSSAGEDITDAQLAELLTLIRSTEWASDLIGLDPYNKDMAVFDYLKLHDRYTASHDFKSYMPYMRKVLTINAANVPSPAPAPADDSDDWRTNWLMNS